jgi:uncharacterized protein
MDGTSITAWMLQMPHGEVRRLFAQSPERAAGWVRLLAMEGIAQAQVCYGRMLLEGTGVQKNQRAAFDWFTRAAHHDEPDALNMVGRCLENGWGCEIDVTTAAAYYHRAADRGHAWAQYNLGHLYLDGLGVCRNAEMAYRYYLRAATQNHPRAMNLVGRCCEEGWGTPKDFTAAAEWYRRSAEAGYFRGQYNWASILVKCERKAEASQWLDRAGASGTPGVREAVRRVAESLEGGSLEGAGGRATVEARRSAS